MLDEVDSQGDGKKLLDFECVLKGEVIGFVSRLYLGCKKQ